jgi:hypothetical protein
MIKGEVGVVRKKAALRSRTHVQLYAVIAVNRIWPHSERVLNACISANALTEAQKNWRCGRITSNTEVTRRDVRIADKPDISQR